MIQFRSTSQVVAVNSCKWSSFTAPSATTAVQTPKTGPTVTDLLHMYILNVINTEEEKRTGENLKQAPYF